MAIRISSFQEEKSVSQNIFGWEWSIRPLIIWTRILGVYLPDVAYSKSYPCKLTFAYEIFCFLLHVSGEINSLYYLQSTQSVHLSLDQSYGLIFVTTTATWNWAIDFINYSLHGLGNSRHFVDYRASTVDRFDDGVSIRLQAIFPQEN